MVSAEYVIFMTSVCDSEEGFARLRTALEGIDSDIALREKNTLYRCDRPEFFCKINEAEQYETSVVNIDEANGLVSYDFIYAYPPGIPIVAPGEIINSGIIELLKDYGRAGVKLCGITSDNKVRVCITEG
jgi:arginine/lysine/ornithine decarboxylase